MTVQDAHGNPVSDAYTWFGNLGGWYSSAQGIVGPLLAAPGSYNLTAALPGTDGKVQASGSLQAQGGADNPLTLVFPPVGSVRANVFGPDGKAYSNSISATISCSSAHRWVSSYSGALTWQNVLPGTWTLVVHDSRTGGDLAPITLDVRADAETSVDVTLRSLGQVQVTVLDQDGNPAPRDQYIAFRGADGATQGRYTDEGGHVAFTNVASGEARLSTTNYANNFTSTILVTVPDGDTAQATLRLAGSGDLKVTLHTADGRPVQGRYFEIYNGTHYLLGGSTDANGVRTFAPLPLDTSLTLLDYNGNASNPWSGKVPDQTLTLTRNGETADLALTLPLGSLQVAVVRAGTSDPLSGAYVGIGEWRQYGTTSASGIVNFQGVPLDTCVLVDVNAGGYVAARVSCVTVPSSQPSGQVQVALDPVLQATVRMRRANGQDAPQAKYFYNRPGWEYRLVELRRNGQSPDLNGAELRLDEPQPRHLRGGRFDRSGNPGRMTASTPRTDLCGPGAPSGPSPSMPRIHPSAWI